MATQQAPIRATRSAKEDREKSKKIGALAGAALRLHARGAVAVARREESNG